MDEGYLGEGVSGLARASTSFMNPRRWPTPLRKRGLSTPGIGQTVPVAVFQHNGRIGTCPRGSPDKRHVHPVGIRHFPRRASAPASLLGGNFRTRDHREPYRTNRESIRYWPSTPLGGTEVKGCTVQLARGWLEVNVQSFMQVRGDCSHHG